MISVTDYGGMSTKGAQRTKAAKEADEYCRSNGKVMLPDHESSEGVSPGRHGPGATLIFRCLEEGDPELRRPRMRSEPDVTIEDRR
jgi:hypothetical protein